MSAKNLKSLARKQVGVSVSIMPRYNHGINVRFTHTSTYCKDPVSGFTGLGVWLSEGLERKGLTSPRCPQLWKIPREWQQEMSVQRTEQAVIKLPATKKTHRPPSLR